MPSIAISIDGTSVLTWNGDEAAARELEAVFCELSAVAGLPPNVFARSAVADFSGFYTDPAEREVQAMALAYFVLSLDTRDPQRPGKFTDYLPVWDFEIDIGRGTRGRLDISFAASKGIPES